MVSKIDLFKQKSVSVFSLRQFYDYITANNASSHLLTKTKKKEQELKSGFSWLALSHIRPRTEWLPFIHSRCHIFQLSRTQITLTEGEVSNADLLVRATAPPYLLCPIGARDLAATITTTASVGDFTGLPFCPNGNALVQVGSQQEER